MNIKTVILLILVLSGMVAIGWWGEQRRTDEQIEDFGENLTQGELLGVGQGEVVEMQISASNYQYDKKEIRVKKGQKVRLNFVNLQGEHDLVIDGLGARSGVINGSGSEILEFTAETEGTYEFYCSVGQHRQMGMVGNLIVE